MVKFYPKYTGFEKNEHSGDGASSFPTIEPSTVQSVSPTVEIIAPLDVKNISDEIRAKLSTYLNSEVEPTIVYEPIIDDSTEARTSKPEITQRTGAVTTGLRGVA